MDWHRRKGIITALFVSGIVLLIGMAAGSFVLGWRTLTLNNRIVDLHAADEHGHAILQAVVDAETGVRGFALTGEPDYLASYYSGLERTAQLMADAARNPLLARVASPDGTSLGDLIERREARMAETVDIVQTSGPDVNLPRQGSGKQIMDEIRVTLQELNGRLEYQADRLSGELAITARGLSMLLVGSIGLAIAMSIAQFHLFRREITRRGAVEAALQQRHREIALVSQLADSLHASTSRDESYEIVQAYARDILADTSGCLYVYNNSRDQLVSVADWGELAVRENLPRRFGPDECWALRRGKRHVGTSAKGQVRCHHVPAEPARSYMCIPISARGQTSGMLHLESPDTDPERAFSSITRLAQNFADQLSLALVNIELRERLQNLAIRDPLTDLYNRRFLDEALGRELMRAERNGTELSVVMLDIDHFKKVNDSFGHAAGDEILRQLARYLVASLRQSDMICRYGGEELLAVLPDCSVEQASQKAELIRRGLKSLTYQAAGFELPAITVSMGIAGYPSTTRDRTELISYADQALYQAKRTGRDRVVVAGAAAPASGQVARAEQPERAARVQKG